MKYFLSFCIISCVVSLTFLSYVNLDGLKVRTQMPVNRVIGDESFVKAFGRLPDAEDSEKLRIQTHLAFVENKLRDVTPIGLSDAQKNRRKEVLNLLAEYREAGIFPSNYDYPDVRKPCFIDKDGAICAVGYLVEQTAGRELAEVINARHQYDYIQDIRIPELDGWMTSSGFTAEECAMIQPQYYTRLPDEYIVQNKVGTAYAAGSGALLALNGVAGFQNGKALLNDTASRPFQVAGIAGGAASVALGVWGLRKSKSEFVGTKINGKWDYESPVSVIMYGTVGDVYARNPAYSAVSWSNIGVGAASMVLGSWSLIRGDRSPKSNLSVSPLPGSGFLVGFTGRF